VSQVTSVHNFCKLPLTNQVTPRTRVLRNLTSPQAIKFPALYGIWKFVITFTRDRHIFLFRARPIQSKPSFHFLKIHFNVNLPSILCYKWSLYLRFHYQNPVCIATLPVPASYPAQLILDFIILVIFGEAFDFHGTVHR